jgi:hydroxymethylpyrimidine pyrophosphatase-like HAD family hydrolase
MIKLVAVDLDDTLLNNDIKISEENKKAIRECREQVIFYFCHWAYVSGCGGLCQRS